MHHTSRNFPIINLGKHYCSYLKTSCMKLIFTLACVLSSSFLLAQKTISGPLLQSLVKLDLGMRGVGFSYEPTLGNKIAIDLSAGLGGGYYVADNYFEYRWILLDPAFFLVVNPRWYYNRAKR